MKYRKNLRIAALIAAALSFFLAFSAKADTWVIYWYLVGSDIESNGGDASRDLSELLSSQLSPDVKFFIQTGGAKKWHNQQISSSQTQRWLVDSEGMHLLESFGPVHMGRTESLSDFLQYGKSKFQADHRMLILWDHGGGPIGGIGYDELHNMEYLSLANVYDALNRVYGSSDDSRKPFDIIGFDACLQASLESLVFVADWADYMVASEQVEPFNAWDYGFAGELSRDTSISARRLGEIIVETYVKGCFENGTQDVATLSVTDTAKAFPFFLALQDLGSRIQNDLAGSPNGRSGVLARIDRTAGNAERFGTDDDLYEVIDLGQFLESLCSGGNYGDVCERALQTYSDTVVYSLTGGVSQATGLSMYYPVKKSREAFNDVLKNGYFPSLFLIVEGMLTGGINNNQINAIVQSTAESNKAYAEVAEWLKGYGSAEEGSGMENVLSSADLGIESAGAQGAGPSGAGQGMPAGNEDVGAAQPAEPQVALAGNRPQDGGSAEAPVSGPSGSPQGPETAASREDTPPAAGSPLSGSGGQGLADLSQSLLAQAQSLQSMNADIQKEEGISKLEDLAVSLKDDGTTYIEIPKKYLSSVSRVTYVMGMYVEEDKEAGNHAFFLTIGEGGQLTADWDKGIFSDQFAGSWPSIGDNMLPVEATNVTDRYITYDCHVKVNGRDGSMNIVYERKAKKYRIIGFTPQEDTGNGIAQRSEKLKKGDVITPVYSSVTLDDESRTFDTDMDSFKYSDDLVIRFSLMLRPEADARSIPVSHDGLFRNMLIRRAIFLSFLCQAHRTA